MTHMIIEGPYGQLLVHCGTGYIVDREVFDADDDRYGDVAYFIPDSLPPLACADIKDVAFVSHTDGYRGPLRRVVQTGCMAALRPVLALTSPKRDM